MTDKPRARLAEASDALALVAIVLAVLILAQVGVDPEIAGSSALERLRVALAWCGC
jgi:hypothetical protein